MGNLQCATMTQPLITSLTPQEAQDYTHTYKPKTMYTLNPYELDLAYKALCKAEDEVEVVNSTKEYSEANHSLYKKYEKNLNRLGFTSWEDLSTNCAQRITPIKYPKT